MTTSSAADITTVSQAIEIIPDRLYFVSARAPMRDTERMHCFTTDQTLVYEPFFSDFGPLNLSHLYRFCKALQAKLQNPKFKDRQLVYYCSNKPQFRANAAALIGCFSVLYLDRTPSVAYEPLRVLEPFMPFRDASMGHCSYKLGVLQCLQAIYKADHFKFFDFDAFNPEEYEFFECVENGDLNTLLPGKFIAFSGPHKTHVGPDGYPQLTPEDYFPIWKKYDVKTIVRLNRKMYDKAKFTNAGFKHYDLFFIDGTTPTDEILHAFIELSEKNEGMVAVHCKAGLGRTGTLIACYMMKHYRITAAEAIAWLRICRPGSVIGPQQDYVEMKQAEMWESGDQWRQERSLPQPWAGELEAKTDEDSSEENMSRAMAALSPASERSTPVEPRSPSVKQKQDRSKRTSAAPKTSSFSPVAQVASNCSQKGNSPRNHNENSGMAANAS
jgi:cell division cycle 14